jgi:hypothetical protein
MLPPKRLALYQTADTSALHNKWRGVSAVVINTTSSQIRRRAGNGYTKHCGIAPLLGYNLHESTTPRSARDWQNVYLADIRIIA